MVTDKKTRDEFIEENLGLVHSLCRRFVGKGIDYDDLYQTGCIGLIKAVDGFDQERGLQFSTYAFPVILGEIKRLFRDGGAVKVSRSLKELSLKVTKLKANLELKNGREPTVSELAEELSCSADEIVEAVCVAQPLMSLTYQSENGVREYDLPTVSIEENTENRLLLDCAFKKLQKTERDIIYYRYYEGLTQAKTAEKLSMTQVQISRSEKRILKSLRGLVL